MNDHRSLTEQATALSTMDDRLAEHEAKDVADYQAEQLREFPALAEGARTVASILTADAAPGPMTPPGTDFRESTHPGLRMTTPPTVDPDPREWPEEWRRKGEFANRPSRVADPHSPPAYITDPDSTEHITP
jgi:hypothetical protein